MELGENMAIEIEMIKWVQQFASPQIDQFFTWVTMLGEETVYIVLLTFLYWCVNKTLGRRLLFGLTLSVWTNGLIKTVLNFPRPIGTDGIRSLRVETATGSSFPSGHTQTVAVFMWMVGKEIQKKWFYVLGILLTLSVALSRVYLGVHWPKDVIGAVVVALIIGQIATAINRDIERSGNYMPLFIITIIAAVTMIFFTEEAYIKTVALLIGYVIGYALEENFVNFDVRGSIDLQLVKYIIGLAGIVGIKYGFSTFLPENDVIIFSEYFLIIIWGMFIAPYLFVKLKLARHRIF